MKHTVELIDELYGLFKENKQLIELLGITDVSNKKEMNKKIRRQLESTDIVDETIDSFFVYTFIPSISNTYNYKVNKSMLEFRIVARHTATLNKLYLCIKHILQDNYEDMQIISEGSFATGSQNLIGYTFRVRPLTWS